MLVVLGCIAAAACSGVATGSAPQGDNTTAAPRATNPVEAKSSMSAGAVPPATLEAALDDAARRLQVDRASITVVSGTAVTWSDGSLGCPAPGMEYTQALVPGYRIVLQAGDLVLNYHAARAGAPTFCPAERVIPPAPMDDAAI
jgi:hypothetical protein